MLYFRKLTLLLNIFIMNKTIILVLSAFIWIGLTVLIPEKVLAQPAPKEKKIETTDNVSQGEGDSTYVKGVTKERSMSIIAGVVGLASIVMGWRAAKTRRAKTGAIIALLLGLVGIVLSIVHLSTSAGAVFGSGSGKAGAIVALALGVIGTWLSVRAIRTNL